MTFHHIFGYLVTNCLSSSKHNIETESFNEAGCRVLTQFPKRCCELPSHAFSIFNTFYIAFRQDALLWPERPQRLHFMLEEFPAFCKTKVRSIGKILNFRPYYKLQTVLFYFIYRLSYTILS